jgi:hypothetical protein
MHLIQERESRDFLIDSVDETFSYGDPGVKLLVDVEEGVQANCNVCALTAWD